MKALVMSDTHNNYNAILKILNKENDCGIIIHAGDILSDIERLKLNFPIYNYEYVSGNNDFSFTAPNLKLFYMGTKKIMLTHGHKFNVKCSLTSLYFKACENKADICIFGHTHMQYLENTNGIYILNPGFGGLGQYAVIDVKNDKINIELKSI